MLSYKWQLTDLAEVQKHGHLVFSTFACGGGSSMGYKLAGFDVIGANDIDPQMEKVYRANLHPLMFFKAPIGDLLNATLPPQLYDLDVLDGSPPCSTFSMSGSREKAWKKDKKFREGQSKQVLSDLFFDWIALVDKLKPKVAVAENVKGMLLGNAKAYTQTIRRKMEAIGYDVQIFLLNASRMGVPQRRERVFFIGRRRDLNWPPLQLSFVDAPIVFSEVDDGIVDNPESIVPCDRALWERCLPGDSIASVHPKGNRFNSIKMHPNKVANTIAAGSALYHHTQARKLTTAELLKIGSFPQDYNFLDVDPQYLIGMSVPPVMMARVAHEIAHQWFSV